MVLPHSEHVAGVTLRQDARKTALGFTEQTGFGIGVERVETLIIGGGQAGLAMSYHLKQLGLEHLVLERARIADRWRTQRWDPLMFQFPNWSIALPGHAYSGNDPGGFSHKNAVLQFIEEYAARIQIPVRTGINVVRLRPATQKDRYSVLSDQGNLEARNVVIATGPYQYGLADSSICASEQQAGGHHHAF